MHILTKVHRPKTEGNFCDEQGKDKKNLSSLQTTISTCATATKGTEWLIAIQLVGEHGSGQKNYFSTSWA